MIDLAEHERFMGLALMEAQIAGERGDVPVGAVIVHDGIVLARAANQREMLRDPTAHAEIVALTQAASALDRWRLDDCTMYVTLEPCPMCAGALVQARLGACYFGAEDPKAGACGSLYHIPADRRLNHRVPVVGGIRAEESAALLRRFFQRQRSLGKK